MTKLEAYIEKFPWGRVVQVHKIGDIAIIEAISDTSGMEGETQFHGWVGDKNTCHAYSDLDAAIVGTIAYKYQGPNSQAGMFFCRMVEMDKHGEV